MNLKNRSSLSIIIVNYNGEQLLSACLRSIEKYTDINHEIIVVDNASTDNSITLLKQDFPSVKLIQNKKNVGFASGNNIGIKHAQGEFLLLLNNDSQLTCSVLPAINQLESQKNIGIVGGLLKQPSGEIQPSYGYNHTPLKIVFSWLTTKKNRWFPKIFKRIETDISKYNEIKEVEWVSGAFLLTRKNLWNDINGMDERYFMYIEDVDFCKRVKEYGCKIIFSNRIEAIHHIRAGKPQIDFFSLMNTSKSYSIYTEKFYHKTGKIFVQIGLGIVYTLRGLGYSIMNLLQTSHNKENKTSQPYFATAFLLFTNKIKNANT